MNLVIVESPAKAKTINKYLGNNYQVVASYGHVRELPSKEGSVKPDEDFALVYQISEKSKKIMANIAKAVKIADKIFLATDPDREGESISWHILEALIESKTIKKTTIVKRVVFNEITKKAVTYAIENPRDLDMNLVNAQQARRALDYLVGFKLSPLLWRKLPGSKSAGRVQSVALRLISEKDNVIENFITQEYWDIKLELITKLKEKLVAALTHYQEKKLAKFDLTNQKQAEQVCEVVKTKAYKVVDIEKKQISRNPQPPFTTSSLQQEASRKLGFSTKYTMQLAQKLYEGIEIAGESIGLITYMRTDAVYLAKEALDSARNEIKKLYGNKYLPADAKIYKAKAKNAQEAHEAIRPTDFTHHPAKIKQALDKDLFKLYELIWKRTMASQMSNALIDLSTITIISVDNQAKLKVTGSILNFDGFYRLYQEGLDDQQTEEYKLLPTVKIGEILELELIKPAQHFTEPPPRFSEASLVKKLEEVGIGRPSTYATIISVLQEREYVKLDKKRFTTEERGRIVTAFLESFFSKYVEYDFTAKLEDQLDEVSEGKLKWKNLLKSFWSDFSHNIEEVGKLAPSEILSKINQVLEDHFFPLNSDGSKSNICPVCQKTHLTIKLGKFGAFIACSAYPDCKYTRQLQDQTNNNDLLSIEQEELILGLDPLTKEEIFIKKGPYGHYLQLGITKDKKKPKRITIPNFYKIEELELAQAIALINLPKNLGNSSIDNQPIFLGIGKFGPYLLHNKKYTSLNNDQQSLLINLKQADQLLATSQNKVTNLIRVIGNDPQDNQPIELYNGKYGPYLKYKKQNIKINKNINIDELDLRSALEVIAKNAKKD